jgi:thiamine kinase-like enzyme
MTLKGCRRRRSSTAPRAQNIIDDFSHFLATLNQLSQQTSYENFANARDYRDQLSDYTLAINRRLLQIENGCQLDNRFNAIGQFIQETFKPLHQKVLLQYQNHLLKFGLDENNPLPKSQKILSPSDFGMHNAIFDCTGHFTFIDFEYFGWDDPAKLVADFLHHAGQDVISTSERLEILKIFTQWLFL